MTAAGDWDTCHCGKRSYRRKLDAKTVRRIHGGDHLSVYRCTASGYWHIGHRPSALTRGDISRDDVAPPKLRIIHGDEGE